MLTAMNGQVCRVEDILVNGLVKGSIVHIHRARTVIIDTNGTVTASGLGICSLLIALEIDEFCLLGQCILY